jgi:hypothetical protein
VTNTGNTPLASVSVSDPTAGPVTCPSVPPAGLAVGASLTCTAAAHTVTQADVDAGQVANTATATGTDQQGNQSPPSAPSTVTIPAVAPAPSIAMVKSAAPMGTTTLTVGEAITYTFVVTNTGNVTLSNVSIVDGAFTGTGPTLPATCEPGAASMAPGAQVRCSTTYIVTQADVNAGHIDNSATTTGTPPSGPAVTSPTSSATVPAPAQPALTVAKVASPPAYTTAGTTVTYSLTVTNTGNVTLNNVSVRETSFTGSGSTPDLTCPGEAALMPPGASVVCTATYVTTQADADADSIRNTAVADGTRPDGSGIISAPSTITIRGPQHLEVPGGGTPSRPQPPGAGGAQSPVLPVAGTNGASQLPLTGDNVVQHMGVAVMLLVVGILACLLGSRRARPKLHPSRRT